MSDKTEDGYIVEFKPDTFDYLFESKVGPKIVDYFNKLRREEPLYKLKDQIRSYDVEVPDSEIYYFVSLMEKKNYVTRKAKFEAFYKNRGEMPKVVKAVEQAVSNAKEKVIDRIIRQQINE